MTEMSINVVGIPWLLLIQFRLPNRLISSQKWFNLMKLWWHSSNILSLYWSAYCNFSILRLPVDRALFESLLVCCVVCWVLADAWDGGGLSLRWLIKADIWMETSKVGGLISVITRRCRAIVQYIEFNLHKVFQQSHYCVISVIMKQNH